MVSPNTIPHPKNPNPTDYEPGKLGVVKPGMANHENGGRPRGPPVQSSQSSG